MEGSADSQGVAMPCSHDLGVEWTLHPPSQPMAALPPLHAVGRVNRRQTAEAKAPPQLVLRLSSSYTDTHMCTHAHAHNHVTTAMGGGV